MTNSYPLFSGSSFETAPAQTPNRRRFFYRCLDCLSVVATENRITETYQDARGVAPVAVCDACNGKIEYMGATAGAGIRKVIGYRSPCDDRCTHARGPECECPCGGENHGNGVVVPVYETASVPRLGIGGTAGARGEYFRTVCSAFESAWEVSYGSLRRKRSAGEFLPASDWSRYTAGCKLWEKYIHARGVRSYARRNKDIENLTGEVL